MKPILYLALHTLKNRILSLRRRPAMAVLYLALIAFIVFSLSGSGHIAMAPGEGGTDIGWLKLFFLGYALLFAYTHMQTALSTGSALFSMADAHYLFVGPLSPKLVLGYAILRQAGASIGASFFVLMMGPTLSTFWGIGPGGLLVIFAGYVLSLLSFQILSVCIYMYSKGRPAVKRGVVVACAVLLLPTLITLALPLLRGQALTAAVLSALNGNVLFTLPVAGWVTQGVFALLAGQGGTAALAFGLLAAFWLVLAVLLVKGRPDYYEDVLVAAETAYQRQQAAKEGNLDSTLNTRKVRSPAASRELWGRGASVFLGKHLVEIGRSRRLKIFDMASVTLTLTALFMAVLLRGEDGGWVSVLITTMVMRTFLISTGLGLREPYMHYIFLIPEPSFKKLFWANLELGVKSLCESLVIYIATGLVLGTPPLITAASIAASTLFAFLLVALDQFSMRVFASVISQGILLMLYFLMVLVVMLPGIAGMLIVTLGFGAGAVAGLALLSAWELLAALLFFWLSRGVLDSCDIQTMPQKN